jgi:hypothetical protein
LITKTTKEKQMKYKAILAIILMTAPVVLLAAQKNSGSVTFSETVTVNGTQIPPGDYRVEWQGTGPSVEVTIVKAGKVLVSSSATLVTDKTGLNGAFEAKDGENDSHILNVIDWANFSLRFDHAKSGTANTAE